MWSEIHVINESNDMSELSCLYLSQVPCGYEVQMDMYFVYILSESPSLIIFRKFVS